MKLLLSFLLLFLGASCLLQAQNTRKVLIIGIDGCRSDALQNANTPNLDALLDYATYSYDALTHGPTWSATGWSSMLTGVWETKHNAYSNAFNGTNFTQYPHFFSRIELNPVYAALNTVSICNWSPINTEIVAEADSEINLATDLAVKDEAVNVLTNQDPDVLFLHFDDVDHAGHANGFTANGSTYLSTIETTDTYAGEVLTAMRNRPNYAQEDWLIMVTTDHGGANGHGGFSLIERVIFVIAAREGNAPEEISKVSGTSSIANGLQLNGVDQYLQPANSAPFNFGTSTDFSVELRVRATNLAGDASFISNKNWISGSNPGWVISTPVPDQSRWKVNVGDGTNRADLDGGTINDGNWHHLTATFDRDGMMKIYQDSEFLGETDISGIGSLDTGLDLLVGQDGTGNYGEWYNGSLREIRIWNTVLDAETINEYACQSLDASHPNAASLIAYYRMDEGSGSTVANIVDAANPMTLNTGTPNWNTPASTLACVNYDQTPRQVDVTPTVLEHLMIPIDPAWEFDGESLLSGAVLPLELLAFTARAQAKTTVLEWRTEVASPGFFSIERSSDGIRFAEIGTEAGNAGYPEPLQFTDRAPRAGINFYRLKYTDLARQVEYSPIRSVEFGEGISWKVQPNPVLVNEELTLIWEADLPTGPLPYRWTDLNGRTISTGEINVNGESTRLPVSRLPKGVYLLQIGEQVQRVVVN